MKQWLNEEALLTVEAGSGALSRYELEELCVGSVVRSVTEAGMGCLLRLNGEFFARGSVVVIDGSNGEAAFGAFIDSLEMPDVAFPRSHRGARATELLPFTIRVAALPVTMRQLEGIGPGSLVNLDCPCQADGLDTQALLIVAGIAVASGTVTVIGENMGLRITALSSAFPSGSAPCTTGAVLAPGYSAEPVKNYNFRMPDRFTKRAIMRAADIHGRFLQLWQSRFPRLTDWKIILVDQLNFGEWLDDAGRPSALILSCPSAERQREYPLNDEVRFPDTFLLEGRGVSKPLVERELSGLREWSRKRLFPGKVPPLRLAFDSRAAELLQTDSSFEIGLSALRAAWLETADLRLGAAAGAERAAETPEPRLREQGDRYAMILLLRLESPDGGRLDIVYPDALLDPFCRFWVVEAMADLPAALRRLAQETTVRGGRAFHYQDDLCQRAVYLEQGTVRAVKFGSDGRSFDLPLLMAGSWFGLAELLSGTVCLFDAVAQDECQALSFSRAALEQALRDGAVTSYLMKELSAQIIRTHRALSDEDSAGKILGFLLERRIAASGGPERSCLRLTQTALAAAVGLARETVNRQLHELEESGLVRISRGEIAVPDWDALRNFAETRRR